MAVTPLSSAAAAGLPVAPQVPASPAEPAVAVTPAAAGTDSGSAGDALADPNAYARLPLEKALDDINSQMKAWSTQLQFEVDPDVNRVIISVLDSQTGEVLRTIPSDTVIRLAKMIVKLQGNAVHTAV
ncbi:flagellar protein FlaG [Bordetella sp. 2513F-2]